MREAKPMTDPPEPAQVTCASTDWYSQGQVRTVRVNGVKVSIRLVSRRGRRARIRIVAPAGAEFNSMEGSGYENVEPMPRQARSPRKDLK